MQSPDKANARSRVQVIESCGEWFVHVTKGGRTAATNSFEIEALALAFAERQRIRLGLERYERL
ncbi:MULTISPECIES: hypothetical protein [unclassified Mesorhizobium]|uniref:hypothetical protein n=1 Tax=unclassified Mesorhizobium TaxID=325217 RepID=UPI001CCE2779|nr:MULTISPECIES: hypothetical protein [unclassified Mesorhizobium]MBZ9737794.1 hypothetical protein [Mesorhizobium sp. CO1-1-4]MBZ9802018.1 hypothetical protein [Mesorhizobium sp. ES1-6]